MLIIYTFLVLIVSIVDGITINSNTVLPTNSLYSTVTWNAGHLEAHNLRVTGTLRLRGSTPREFTGSITADHISVEGEVQILCSDGVSSQAIIDATTLHVLPYFSLSSTPSFAVTQLIDVDMGYLSLDTTLRALSPVDWKISMAVVELYNTSEVSPNDPHVSTNVDIMNGVLELTSGRPMSVTGSCHLERGRLGGHDNFSTLNFISAVAEFQLPTITIDGTSHLSHFVFWRPRTELSNLGHLTVGHRAQYSLPFLYFEEHTGIINHGTLILDDVLAFYHYNHRPNSPHFAFISNTNVMAKDSSDPQGRFFETNLHFSSSGTFTLAFDNTFRLFGSFPYSQRHFVHGSAYLEDESLFLLYQDSLHFTNQSQVFGDSQRFYMETDLSLLQFDHLYDGNLVMEQDYGTAIWSNNSIFLLDKAIARNNVIYKIFEDQSTQASFMDLVQLTDKSRVSFFDIHKELTIDKVLVKDEALLKMYWRDGTATFLTKL
ncbi:hypothetical protein GEMRC1_003257 [Eukaryota sp. GEM-RC1]